MFLLLADRDAIGSHGQNKGFKDGRFFAIDPGHSLEGNGKDLEIHDDLSFVDKSVNLFEKRFKNFSVFDDSTHFEKFQGVLDLRNLKNSNKIEQLYNDYCAKFMNPPEADKELSKMILTRLESMKKELDSQMAKILNAFEPHLKFYDAMMAGIEVKEQGDDQVRPQVDQKGKRRDVIQLYNPNPAVSAKDKQFIVEHGIETLSNLEKLLSKTKNTTPKGEPLLHLEVVQNTRVPWSAKFENGIITYTSSKPLSKAAQKELEFVMSNARMGMGDNVVTVDRTTGRTQIVLAVQNSVKFFNRFDESTVMGRKR
jgi:hypothetical protein